MKKKLDVGNITNELRGASLFFTKSASPPSLPESEKPVIEKAANPLADSPFFEKTPTPLLAEKEIDKEIEPKVKKQKQGRAEEPIKRDTATPLYHDSTQASNNASMHASNHSLIEESIIETIRKAVKDVGKDSATYRFTPEEKKALLELSFSYKMQGYKTSENELTRIAINFILEDHKQNGQNSILRKVLEALNK